MKPQTDNAVPDIETAIEHHRAGRLQRAEAIYRQLPGNADAWHLRGIIAHQAGNNGEAVGLIVQALALQPSNAAYYRSLGAACRVLNRPDDAADCYRQALALNPDYAEAHNDLGLVLKDQGRLNDAAACYLKAIELDPDFSEAYNNLGLVFAEQGNPDAAIECYQTALALKPDSAETHNNLGIELRERGKLDDAMSCFRTALALKPVYADAYCNLGITLQHQGRSDEAIASCRQALTLRPAYVDAYQILLLALQYSATHTPKEVFAEHQRFGQQFEALLKNHWTAHPNPRDPHKRLKIGYVSPDFRRHAVAYFIEPLLACHDKSQVEVFCYYNHTQYDPVTQRLQALADHWVLCKDMPDDRLAERIRADGIDILIDLAGHTRGTRLLAFARKPAPVQVTYLGYPATTGLTAIDYRLTDVHAEPPGMTEQLNVERLWRLPEFFCVYRAHDNSPDVIDHPPADDNGYVTFGCFNNFAKVTDPVLKLWARLLDKVPTARLMLEINGIDNPGFRTEVESRLDRLGIPAERLILIPRKPENQYVLYNRIDIALDPFPQNGGTTSLDTLWMGVPFVTLAGRHFSSRMGVTILTNAGLSEFIAAGEEEYVNIAATLAQDRERLKNIRAGLRERVRASPLMDAPRFTRHMEQAYRAMWRNWCAMSDAHDEGKKPLYS